MNNSSFLFSILFFFFSFNALSQERGLSEAISELGNNVPGLTETVKINIGKSSLSTVLSGLGQAHNINIAVDPNLNEIVTANFTNETAGNVLVYLIERYDIDYKISGSIISLKKKKEVPEIKMVEVSYNKPLDLLSYNLNNDLLSHVTQKITDLTGNNFVLDPSLNAKIVGGYIQDLSLQSAIEKLALSNSISMQLMDDGTYFLKNIGTTSNNGGAQQSFGNNSNTSKLNTRDISLNISFDSNGQAMVSVNAIDKSVSDIIKYVFNEAKLNYVFFTEPDENATLSITNMYLSDFLSYLLNATEFTFKDHGDVYSFGLRGNEKLRNTELLKVNHRSLRDVIAVIPPDLSYGVSIYEFPELNSLILSGSAPNIQEVSALIQQIDQPVPVVMIELIIMDISNTYNVSTGIEMGLASEPVKTIGTILPGVDVTLSSASINTFLNTIGLSKLGRVTPNFYMSLSAMEANGDIKIRSTPQLATLNSHQATLNIGETSYYLEQQQNVVGTQNPQTIITNQFQAVNADFSINITPVVSGDEQVTMEVEVNQSTFTARISPQAPPGQASRNFKSTIRVKNEEMIVLGGLEREENSQSGSGLPGLSRIPILKWFFGKRQKKRENSKLVIFIKPTIIY